MTRPDFSSPTLTLAEAVIKTRQTLEACSIDEAARLARQAVMAVCQLSPTALLTNPERPLTIDEAAQLAAITTRLCQHEPLSKILHARDFYGLEVLTSRHVLDPRPDTETLVTAALESPEFTNSAPKTLLELGVGSGAVLLALRKAWPQTTIIGVDRSLEACKITLANLTRHNATTSTLILCANWADALSATLAGKKFDLIVSNPPYIPDSLIKTLSPMVKDHDPYMALAGGTDGLRDYARIFQSLPRLLEPDGILLIEIGVFSLLRVLALLHTYGLCLKRYHKDLSGKIRVLTIGFAPSTMPMP